MSTTHYLKCWPKYFAELRSGRKPFELRKNDREFEIGDRLVLEEWDEHTKEYTGAALTGRIDYMTDAPFALRRGYVALGLGPLTAAGERLNGNGT